MIFFEEIKWIQSNEEKKKKSENMCDPWLFAGLAMPMQLLFQCKFCFQLHTFAGTNHGL